LFEGKHEAHSCRTDLDPSQDTPVEVLHVVLLGFVKYFWRDVVSRLGANEKQLLIQRLDSLDLRALGLPSLRGTSLVKYAGSLTGRDFRAIIQVAPLVLYGLRGLPDEAYEAWLSLARLVPLVYQLEICDLEAYLVSDARAGHKEDDQYCYQADLTNAIDDFLASTALWTTEWFNKSKFHVLVHLPDHVRRFGPAILFATEGFESYNAVIRLRSIHSSRQAPSKDIAESFSHLHAVRHLVCGGAFSVPGIPTLCFPGVHVRSLLSNPRFAAILGRGEILLDDMETEATLPDKVALSKRPQPVPWRATAASQVTPMPWSILPSTPLVHGVSAALPSNPEERVCLDGMVVFTQQKRTQFGHVQEILVEHNTRNVVGVLVQPHRPGPLILPYRFYAAVKDKQAAAAFIPLCVRSVSCVCITTCSRVFRIFNVLCMLYTTVQKITVKQSRAVSYDRSA
jgi:hypothetical protein